MTRSEQVDRSGITWRASTAGRSTLRRRDIREGIACSRVERTGEPSQPVPSLAQHPVERQQAREKGEAAGTISSIECEQ